MLATAPKPAPPLAVGTLPRDVGLSYELYACTVDPRQVRLVVYEGKTVIDFTRRLPSRADAESYIDRYATDPVFRKSERAAVTAYMELY